jgi:amino acid transporter
MTDKEKIDALIENYKTVSEESNSYLTEMIRCFPYAAIVIGIGLGYGEHTERIIKYMPLALLALMVYFFSLGFMYVNASRYKAQIENKINNLAGDQLFGFELNYKPDLLKTGFLPLGKKFRRVLPVPNFLLGLVVLAAFIYLGKSNITVSSGTKNIALQTWPFITVGILFGLIALYVFLIIPRIIEQYQKNSGKI